MHADPAPDGATGEPTEAMQLTQWLSVPVITVAIIAVCIGARSGPDAALLRPRGKHVCAPHGSLVAIADLHGDIEKAKAVLKLLCLTDDADNWKAEGVTVVQLGDLVDRGASSLELLLYIHKLQDQARNYNSSLVLLTGNHELANLQGDFRYVSTDELLELGKEEKLKQQQQQADDSKDVSRTPGNSESDDSDSSLSRQDDGDKGSYQSDIDTYLEGMKVWAALWQLPELTPASSAAQGVTTDSGGMPASEAAGEPERGPSLPVAAAADNIAGAGVIRSSIAARHQLMSVQGQGTPCATAFIHAGLLPRVLHQLRKLAAAHTTNSSRLDRAEAGSEDAASSVQSQQQQRDLHTGDKQEVAVGVVNADELQQLNNMFQQAVTICDDRSCSDGPSYPAVQQVWSLMGSQQGPMWNRQQALGQEAGVCRQLDQVLQQLDVQRLVVGHTPQRAGRVMERCGGRLLLLDTGMSRGMLDNPAAAWICSPGGAGGSHVTTSSCRGEPSDVLSSRQGASEVIGGTSGTTRAIMGSDSESSQQVTDPSRVANGVNEQPGNQYEHPVVRTSKLCARGIQHQHQMAVIYADRVVQPL